MLIYEDLSYIGLHTYIYLHADIVAIAGRAYDACELDPLIEGLLATHYASMLI